MGKININYIDYSPASRSLDLFVAGCNPPYCKDCCNPELLCFDNGKNWASFKEIITEYIMDFNNLIDNIFLLGGSFNHQNEDELVFILDFLSTFNKDIWLFAREDLAKVKPIFKKYCKYIKCGEYIPDLYCTDNIQNGIRLATSNQVVYKRGIDYNV